LDTIVAVTLLDDFFIDVNIESQIGSKTKVNNLPKLEEIIKSRLSSLFYDYIVQPNYMHFLIPQLFNDESEMPETASNDTVTSASRSQSITFSHSYSSDFMNRTKKDDLRKLIHRKNTKEFEDSMGSSISTMSK
jgi:hypothetical protein